MNLELLEKLVGGDREWSGPCTVILDADAVVQSSGPDHIMGGGLKTYAPRHASGRLDADTCLLMKDHQALILVRQMAYKDSTGSDCIKQSMLVVDTKHVVALEYPHTHALKKLDVPPPFIPEDAEYRPGMLVG
jgi:hypothetical protein